MTEKRAPTEQEKEELIVICVRLLEIAEALGVDHYIKFTGDGFTLTLQRDGACTPEERDPEVVIKDLRDK